MRVTRLVSQKSPSTATHPSVRCAARVMPTASLGRAPASKLPSSGRAGCKEQAPSAKVARVARATIVARAVATVGAGGGLRRSRTGAGASRGPGGETGGKG